MLVLGLCFLCPFFCALMFFQAQPIFTIDMLFENQMPCVIITVHKKTTLLSSLITNRFLQDNSLVILIKICLVSSSFAMKSMDRTAVYSVNKLNGLSLVEARRGELDTRENSVRILCTQCY